jgi:hypothetical protein
MAAFNKFNDFAEQIGLGVHNLDTGVLKIYLSNVAPVATNTVKADIAEITNQFGYTAPIDITGVWSESPAGTGKLVAGNDPVVITASGGTIGPFRYVILYNDTPTSPADPLIGWWDYLSAVTLQDGETFTVDFGASVLTIT